eukprot:2237434-Prymnesium_polylepis.2
MGRVLCKHGLERSQCAPCMAERQKAKEAKKAAGAWEALNGPPVKSVQQAAVQQAAAPVAVAESAESAAAPAAAAIETAAAAVPLAVPADGGSVRAVAGRARAHHQ